MIWGVMYEFMKAGIRVALVKNPYEYDIAVQSYDAITDGPDKK